MPLNLRTPEGEGPAPAHTYPISRSLALIVFLSIVALFALRHLFGSVHLEAGLK